MKWKTLIIIFLWMVVCFLAGTMVAIIRHDARGAGDPYIPFILPKTLTISVRYNDINAKCKTGNHWIEVSSPELDRGAGICFPRTATNYQAAEKTAKVIGVLLGQEVNFTYRPL